MGTIAKITVDGSTHLLASTAYAICSTEANIAAKTAVIQDNNEFTLFTGVTVHVKFTASNSAAMPTLNINGTGAYFIKQYGTTSVGNTEATSWKAGATLSVTFDGNYWQLNGAASTGSEYTSEEKTKLASIEAGAEVNVLEGVQVNGTDLTISENKKVNVPVFTGVTESQSSGKDGLVPAPLSAVRFVSPYHTLRADGTWKPEPVWSAYESSGAIKLNIPNSAGTAYSTIEAISTSQKGAESGVCPLDESGMVSVSVLPDATTSSKGIMSASDKIKLDGIAEGAEANVLEGVQMNGTDLAITDKKVNVPVFTSSSGTASGSVGLVPAPSQSGSPITLYKFLGSNAKWAYVKPQFNQPTTGEEAGKLTTNLLYTYEDNTTGRTVTAVVPEATTSSNGAMSSADKTKLDGIEGGAEVNLVDDVQVNGASVVSSGIATIPTANTNTFGVAKIGYVSGSPVEYYLKIDTGETGVNYPYKVPLLDSNKRIKALYLPEATTSTKGVMTAEDKTKLDGIESGAEVNVNADWNATSGDAQILNKPEIPNAQTMQGYVNSVYEDLEELYESKASAGTEINGYPLEQDITLDATDIYTDSTGQTTIQQALNELSTDMNTKSSVSWSQLVSSGVQIASISIDGNTVQVFSPTSGGGSSYTPVLRINGSDYSILRWEKTTLNNISGINFVYQNGSLESTIFVPDSEGLSYVINQIPTQPSDIGALSSVSLEMEMDSVDLKQLNIYFSTENGS